MVATPPGRTQKKRGRTQFPGIVEDARSLGVSRVHLFLVLTGQRTSKGLLNRYKAFQRQLKGAAR